MYAGPKPMNITSSCWETSFPAVYSKQFLLGNGFFSCCGSKTPEHHQFLLGYGFSFSGFKMPQHHQFRLGNGFVVFFVVVFPLLRIQNTTSSCKGTGFPAVVSKCPNTTSFCWRTGFAAAGPKRLNITSSCWGTGFPA